MCDTGNNVHDGYCPMRADDEKLEWLTEAMIEEMASLKFCGIPDAKDGEKE